MFEVKQKGKCAKEQDKRASMNTWSPPVLYR
jgi:hypothetical protein